LLTDKTLAACINLQNQFCSSKARFRFQKIETFISTNQRKKKKQRIQSRRIKFCIVVLQIDVVRDQYY